MGSGPMVVTEIRIQGSLQMPGVENDEMVQAVSSDRTDQAFGVGILPGTTGRGEQFLDAQRGDPLTDVVAVKGVPIANQISRYIPIGKSLDDLLGRPGCGGIRGDIEVQHLPTTVFQDDEYEQHPHGDRWNGKEIDRNQLADVVVKKRLPGLTRRPAKASQNSRDRALGDRDAEHLQFAVNSWRTPQRIGGHHSLDQLANLCPGTGPASATALRLR